MPKQLQWSSLPSGVNQPIVYWLCLLLAVMRLTAAERRFALTSVCRQGGDFLDCSVSGLRAGPAATGVRLRGEGISALPN